MLPSRIPSFALGLLWLGAPTASAQVARVDVDPGRTFQSIDGFGVNFNGTCFRDAQKPAIDLLVDDLGATMFRLDPCGLSNWEARNDDDDPRHMNRAYYDDPLADETVMSQLAVLSVHSYGPSEPVVAPRVAHVRESRHPGTRVCLTEYGSLEGGFSGSSPRDEWTVNALPATRRALEGLNAGARAALPWDAFDNYHERAVRLHADRRAGALMRRPTAAARGTRRPHQDQPSSLRRRPIWPLWYTV